MKDVIIFIENRSENLKKKYSMMRDQSPKRLLGLRFDLVEEGNAGRCSISQLE